MAYKYFKWIIIIINFRTTHFNKIGHQLKVSNLLAKELADNLISSFLSSLTNGASSFVCQWGSLLFYRTLSDSLSSRFSQHFSV